MGGKVVTASELRATAKAFNKHEGNLVHIATELGISRGGVQARIRRIREDDKGRATEWLKNFDPKTGGPPGIINNPIYQKAAGKMFEEAGSTKAVAAALGINEATARQTISKALGDQVEVTRERAQHSVTRDKLNRAIVERNKFEEELNRMRWAAKAGFDPADWSLSGRKGKKGEHVPLLFVSDAQVGEVIDGEATGHGRGYNTPIFRERYRQLIDTAIYLLTEHVGSDWRFPGFIYVRGGDAVSGAIHEELAQTDDLTPLEACRVVFEEEAAGIAKLAEQFGKVDVKSVSGGNHDRDTRKPQSKKRVGHNLDAMIDFMLANHFRNDKRVTFQLTKGFDVIFPCAGRNILCTHGDNIGSRGGEGFIGPLATVARGVQKVIMEQQALNVNIDFTMMGHFHTMFQTRKFLVNGCFPGYSEFAKQNRMSPEPASQALTIWHAKHGMVDFKPIVLQ